MLQSKKYRCLGPSRILSALASRRKWRLFSWCNRPDVATHFLTAQGTPCTPEDDASTRVQLVVERVLWATAVDANTCRWLHCHHRTVHDIHEHGVCREVRPVSPAAGLFMYLSPTDPIDVDVSSPEERLPAALG